MPQSLLDKMDYTQLKNLAESRGCLPEEPHNSEAIRKAIHDWEIDRGLPFKGLREIATKNTENEINLSEVLQALSELQTTVNEVNERLKRLENKHA